MKSNVFSSSTIKNTLLLFLTVVIFTASSCTTAICPAYSVNDQAPAQKAAEYQKNIPVKSEAVLSAKKSEKNIEKI